MLVSMLTASASSAVPFDSKVTLIELNGLLLEWI